MSVSPSSLPRSGSGWPGYASCQRISIIRLKPKKRNARAVTPYWMPIILWSTEKMYLRQKGSSWCPWPSWACPWPLPPLWCWTLIESSPGLERGLLLLFGRGGRGGFLPRRRVLRLPLREGLGGADQYVPPPPDVPETARLGSAEREVARVSGAVPVLSPQAREMERLVPW